jgi:7-carboxy-7-deazaguanine synthase
MSTLNIDEIFYSIQGEGKWMGLPNIFIRTMGCNLKCFYCDTIQFYKKGVEKSIEEIQEEVSFFNCKKICVTGGEPLIQENISDLLSSLNDNDYSLCLETNGSKSIKPFLHFDNMFFSLDIKCPSSGMKEHNNFSNLQILRSFDQVKCIIGNKEDYNYAKKVINKFNLSCLVFFQPVWGFSLQKLSSWILADHLSVYLGIQLHKYIWGCTTGK